jgi:hypothetical protein
MTNAPTRHIFEGDKHNVVISPKSIYPGYGTHLQVHTRALDVWHDTNDERRRFVAWGLHAADKLAEIRSCLGDPTLTGGELRAAMTEVMERDLDA